MRNQALNAVSNGAYLLLCANKEVDLFLICIGIEIRYERLDHVCEAPPIFGYTFCWSAGPSLKVKSSGLEDRTTLPEPNVFPSSGS
jgi:hypothetical protein